MGDFAFDEISSSRAFLFFDKRGFLVIVCICALKFSVAPAIVSKFSGCRIPVVRLLWEQVDRVQFPASRQWY